MSRYDVRDLYFKWLYNIVCDDMFNKHNSYIRLLSRLHEMEFTWLIDRDSNRAEEGIGLRYRFAYCHLDIPCAEDYLEGPCSVLEMIIALAIRCEENIMDDPHMGDRTKQWFWGMITNLGLGGMSDGNYDESVVVNAVVRFLNRDYSPNGKGGLFTVRNYTRDLREVEIWHQLCWYLDGIT